MIDIGGSVFDVAVVARVVVRERCHGGDFARIWVHDEDGGISGGGFADVVRHNFFNAIF